MNKYFDKMRPNYSRDCDCQETDTAEILTLIELMYVPGVKEAQHLNVKEI